MRENQASLLILYFLIFLRVSVSKTNSPPHNAMTGGKFHFQFSRLLL